MVLISDRTRAAKAPCHGIYFGIGPINPLWHGYDFDFHEPKGLGLLDL